MTPTARIQLFQLTFQSRDGAPDGAPYASKPLALKAQQDAARACLGYIGSTPETLRDALENGDVKTLKPLDQIETLDDLTDAETFELAETWADFRSDIYPSWVEVEVYTLTSALSDAGCAVTVFTVDDVTDRFAGDDPAGWLRANRRNIEDILSSRGNEAIDDLLIGDGLYVSEDDDEDEAEADDEEAAMRERGVTPEAFAESMVGHTAFIFGYGADVSKVRDPSATRYATLDSIRAETGMRRAVIYEIRTEPDERGFNEVVKVHARH